MTIKNWDETVSPSSLSLFSSHSLPFFHSHMQLTHPFSLSFSFIFFVGSQDRGEKLYFILSTRSYKYAMYMEDIRNVRLQEFAGSLKSTNFFFLYISTWSFLQVRNEDWEDCRSKWKDIANIFEIINFLRSFFIRNSHFLIFEQPPKVRRSTISCIRALFLKRKRRDD